nr:MAG TPA: hypothetical protein [Caudoviricetes sp.]
MNEFKYKINMILSIVDKYNVFLISSHIDLFED